jgi:hypothetical protein
MGTGVHIRAFHDFPVLAFIFVHFMIFPVLAFIFVHFMIFFKHSYLYNKTFQRKYLIIPLISYVGISWKGFLTEIYGIDIKKNNGISTDFFSEDSSEQGT